MDDANLSKLSVKQFTISPPFQKTITDYSLTVPSSVDSIEIEATTNDTSASYFLKFKEKDGSKCSVKEGINKIIIEVSSEDGTIKLYNINCIRLSASEAFLSSLSIAGVTVEPNFLKDVFEYNSTVPYSITNALVNVEVNDPKCEIKLVYSGKEQIKTNGVNLMIEFNYGRTFFAILVKSPDGSKTQVYIFCKSF
jgi:trimeric autotransporter adhesin